MINSREFCFGVSKNTYKSKFCEKIFEKNFTDYRKILSRKKKFHLFFNLQ